MAQIRGGMLRDGSDQRWNAEMAQIRGGTLRDGSDQR